MHPRNIIIGITIGFGVLFAVKGTDTKLDVELPAIAPRQAVASGHNVESAVEVKYGSDTAEAIELNLPTRQAGGLEFPEDSKRLRELLKESIEGAQVTVTTDDRLRRFENQFLTTLKQSLPWDQVGAQWKQLGWDFQYWSVGGKRYVAICEPDEQRNGRGVYVVQIDSHSRLVLQAPHRFFDTQTGLLTRKLFEENDVLAAAWNTVHRGEIDLAHQRAHYINAMTRALVRFDQHIVVAQIHGFGNEKRQTLAQSASMIVSDTTRYPGRLVRRFAELQKANYGAQSVRLYPSEVTELGGTQNEQARVFHRIGRRGFVHIELDRATREKLTSDASDRGRFFSALTGATAKWQDLPGPQSFP